MKSKSPPAYQTTSFIEGNIKKKVVKERQEPCAVAFAGRTTSVVPLSKAFKPMISRLTVGFYRPLKTFARSFHPRKDTPSDAIVDFTAQRVREAPWWNISLKHRMCKKLLFVLVTQADRLMREINLALAGLTGKPLSYSLCSTLIKQSSYMIYYLCPVGRSQAFLDDESLTTNLGFAYLVHAFCSLADTQFPECTLSREQKIAQLETELGYLCCCSHREEANAIKHNILDQLAILKRLPTRKDLEKIALQAQEDQLTARISQLTEELQQIHDLYSQRPEDELAKRLPDDLMLESQMEDLEDDQRAAKRQLQEFQWKKEQLDKPKPATQSNAIE